MRLADKTALIAGAGGGMGRLAAQVFAREWFGAEFVEQYAAFRQWEVDKHRLAVTDWERRRYFEMV